MKRKLLDIRNIIDFPLRNLVAWKRALKTVQNEDKNQLFKTSRETKIAQAYQRTYHLDQLKQSSSRKNFLENLYYLHLIETAFTKSNINISNPINAVDIGTASWFYVSALYQFIKYWQSPQSREIQLTGFEIDAYRVYNDLYSRQDHALFHIRNLAKTTFVPAAFAPKPWHYDLVFMFFPFLFEEDHIKWGLPSKLHKPGILIEDIITSMKKCALLLIVNQGKQEASNQLKLLENSGLSVIDHFLHEKIFIDYKIPRYVTLCQK